jgi:hypothetical protein
MMMVPVRSHFHVHADLDSLGRGVRLATPTAIVHHSSAMPCVLPARCRQIRTWQRCNMAACAYVVWKLPYRRQYLGANGFDVIAVLSAAACCFGRKKCMI